MISRLFKTLFTVAAIAGLGAAPASAGNFELHGSATVAKKIVAPNQAAIEKQAGLKLNVVMNGSGSGLKDLAAGKAAMAMISAPLDLEAKLTNAKAPGSLDITGMVAHEIGSSEIFFVVNPRNPAKALTEDQVRGILTGKIANWKDVGGADTPILVVVENVGKGTRSMVDHAFMQGEAFSPKARVTKVLAHVTKIVGQAPNAIGYANESSFVKGKHAKVPGVVIQQPLALVTKGDPTPEMRKLIDAVAAHAK